jgi:hypothetical protein
MQRSHRVGTHTLFSHSLPLSLAMPARTCCNLPPPPRAAEVESPIKRVNSSQRRALVKRHLVLVLNAAPKFLVAVGGIQQRRQPSVAAARIRLALDFLEAQVTLGQRRLGHDDAEGHTRRARRHLFDVGDAARVRRVVLGGAFGLAARQVGFVGVLLGCWAVGTTWSHRGWLV